MIVYKLHWGSADPYTDIDITRSRVGFGPNQAAEFRVRAGRRDGD